VVCFNSWSTLHPTNYFFIPEAHCLASDQLSHPTDPAEPQDSTTNSKEPDPPTVKLNFPEPEPNKDVLASIHVTIEEIKSAQEVLEKKKWYYTDRNGKQVDVGERMRRILRSVEDCAKIVDVAIQHHPEISSLVWAGARFILMVGHNSRDFSWIWDLHISYAFTSLRSCIYAK